MTTPCIKKDRGKKIGEDKYSEHWSLDGHTYIQVPKWVITQAHQAGMDEERGRCLRWIGTKSAIFNLFNGDNKNLNVNGQNEYKDLVDRIKSGD